MNLKKLKVLSAEKQGNFSPQINPPLKNSLFTEDFIKKYIIERTEPTTGKQENSTLKQTPKKPPIVKHAPPPMSHLSTMTSNTSEREATAMPSIVSNSRNNGSMS
jgi:hypothetical protein